MSGAASHHAGHAAEEAVQRHYEARGYRTAALRWRCPAGEIDLILRAPDGGLVFVEVKQARSLDAAAHRIRPAQQQRIMMAAQIYAEAEPTGQLTPMRFDVALMDRAGQIRVLEAAFGAW